MSIWTHVNGQIRIDDMRFGTDSNLSIIKNIIGNTCDYHSTDEEWEKCSVPTGSEGSLQYSIIENPDKSSLAAYTVAIWGDLRDFSDKDVDKIRVWFDKILNSSGLWIRQAVLQIEVENGICQILRYEYEKLLHIIELEKK